MYGHNEVAPLNRNPHKLEIVSVFPTLQGEGPDAGRPSVFVRLAKCNLRCHFCDTDFDDGEEIGQSALVDRVVTLAERYNITLCVVTGGEPLLQDFLPLTTQLNDHHIDVAVETAGTLYLPGLKYLFAKTYRNYIVCSPKTIKLNADLIPLIRAYKYIGKAGQLDETDGLPIMCTQIMGKRAKLFRAPSDALVYLQPMDEGDENKNERNLQACIDSCMLFGYRLSIQMHKICGLD